MYWANFFNKKLSKNFILDNFHSIDKFYIPIFQCYKYFFEKLSLNCNSNS